MPQFLSARPNSSRNWLTPPEHFEDSFHIRSSATSPSSLSSAAIQFGVTAASRPLVNLQQALSPPVSPTTKNTNDGNPTVAAAPHGAKDYILFPEIEGVQSPAKPLFECQLSSEAQHLVSQYITTRDVPAGVKAPKREDYELFAVFHEVIWTRFFNSNRAGQVAYLKRERAQLREDAKARSKVVSKGSGATPRQVNRAVTKGKLLMARPAGMAVSSTDVVESATRCRTADKVVKKTTTRPVRVNASHVAHSETNETPPSEKKRAASQADHDFNSIVDYSPPLTSLAPNVMKIPSVSNAREFEKHELPLLHLLHPDEQKLASNLRLDPALYLTSKRRIFHARLLCFLDKKTFRKTQAQQATFIDVNKASKLHTAFESVGWFNDEWMKGIPRPKSEKLPRPGGETPEEARATDKEAPRPEEKVPRPDEGLLPPH